MAARRIGQFVPDWIKIATKVPNEAKPNMNSLRMQYETIKTRWGNTLMPSWIEVHAFRADTDTIHAFWFSVMYICLAILMRIFGFKLYFLNPVFSFFIFALMLLHNCWSEMFLILNCSSLILLLTSVVQTSDSALHRISQFPVDKY